MMTFPATAEERACLHTASSPFSFIVFYLGEGKGLHPALELERRHHTPGLMALPDT